MKKMEPSYQRLMVIVHGLSEQSICSNIKSNLRLPQEIISRDNGRCSIQITSLMPLLNDSRFKDYKSFIRAFPKVEHAKNQLKISNCLSLWMLMTVLKMRRENSKIKVCLMDTG